MLTDRAPSVSRVPCDATTDPPAGRGVRWFSCASADCSACSAVMVVVGILYLTRIILALKASAADLGTSEERHRTIVRCSPLVVDTRNATADVVAGREKIHKA